MAQIEDEKAGANICSQSVSETEATSPNSPEPSSRREALKRIGQLAACTAPAMVVLLSGEAGAHHKPLHNCPPGFPQAGKSPC